MVDKLSLNVYASITFHDFCKIYREEYDERIKNKDVYEAIRRYLNFPIEELIVDLLISIDSDGSITVSSYSKDIMTKLMKAFPYINVYSTPTSDEDITLLDAYMVVIFSELVDDIYIGPLMTKILKHNDNGISIDEAKQAIIFQLASETSNTEDFRIDYFCLSADIERLIYNLPDIDIITRVAKQ